MFCNYKDFFKIFFFLTHFGKIFGRLTSGRNEKFPWGSIGYIILRKRYFLEPLRIRMRMQKKIATHLASILIYAWADRAEPSSRGRREIGAHADWEYISLRFEVCSLKSKGEGGHTCASKGQERDTYFNALREREPRRAIHPHDIDTVSSMIHAYDIKWEILISYLLKSFKNRSICDKLPVRLTPRSRLNNSNNAQNCINIISRKKLIIKKENCTIYIKL